MSNKYSKRNLSTDRFMDNFPKKVEGLNNTSYFYYRNVLLTKLYSVIRPINFPIEWDLDYIYNAVFLNGYMCITDTTAGVLPLECGIGGVNFFNKPTTAFIANPILGTFDRTLDQDCVLLYFWNIYGQYMTVNDIVTRYATKLANVDGSIDISLVNSRVAHVFEADTEGQKRTLEKLYDDVSAGRPAIILKKGQQSMFDKEGNHRDFLNVKNTFIGNDLMLMKKSIMNEFLTEIGIKNANTDKRERLNGDEVNSNNQETRALVDIWVDTLNKCCDKVNAMFGLDIRFKLNPNLTEYHNKEDDEEEEGEEDGV